MGSPRSPRVDVIFRLWQCDKENHGWREGSLRPFPAKVPICWPGLHPPAKSVSNEKRILLCAGGREPSLKTLAGLNGDIGKCVRSSRETRDSSAFPMSDRRQSARIWPAVDATIVGSPG